jgi:hypothetical protein
LIKRVDRFFGEIFLFANLKYQAQTTQKEIVSTPVDAGCQEPITALDARWARIIASTALAAFFVPVFYVVPRRDVEARLPPAHSMR